MGLNGHAAIVKAAPKPRQHFWPFLRVDRDRAERNRALSPIVTTGSVPDFLLMLSPLRILIAPLFGITFLLSVMFPPAGLYRGVFFGAAIIEDVVVVWAALIWFHSSR